MNHVLKDYFLADEKGGGEAPVAHEVAGEAGVAAEAIYVGGGGQSQRGGVGQRLRAAHSGVVGHFEAVGHVAGEGHVEQGGLDAVVLHDVHDGGHERAGLPGEGRARLKDEAQAGVLAAEGLQQADEVGRVVVLPRHEVAAAEVEPLDAVEPAAELLLDVRQRVLQGVAAALAVAMAVEALYAVGQRVGQVLGQHAEARAGGAGIVEFRLYLAVFRVDAQPAGDAFGLLPVPLPDAGHEAAERREGVERDVAAAPQDGVERGFLVGRGVGVGLRAEFLQRQPRLVGRGGRGVGDVFAENGECAPQGECLEGEDELHVGAPSDVLDEGEVAAQAGFF